MWNSSYLTFIFALAVAVMAACGDSEPTLTPTPVPQVAVAATATSKLTPTPTSKPSVTPMPTQMPTPVSSPALLLLTPDPTPTVTTASSSILLTSGNLIVYVDLDGRIQIVQPDNSSTSKVISPQEGFFTWPAWSPDGKQIAFSGVPLSSNGPGSLTLYVSQVEGGQLSVIYTNEPGMGPILDGMPHYPLWSPDSTLLAFMASAPRGLTLFLDSFLDEESAGVVLRNAPLYASWSSDSQYMLVHGGIDHFLVDATAGPSVEEFASRAISYRAPAWQPNTSKVAIMAQEIDGTHSLYVVNAESGEQALIDSIPMRGAFLWSPDGESLAVANSESPTGFSFQNLTIFSADGTRKPSEVQDNLLAYFWSPDSSRLAYIITTRTEGIWRWMVLDIESGDRWPLAEFTPTQGQATVVQFFDQFAHSHSPWSPDSASLVFAGWLQGGGVSASLNRQPLSQIYVVGTGPNPMITVLAEGVLAFWSPR